MIAAAGPHRPHAQDPRRYVRSAGPITAVELQIEGKPETSAPLLALVDIKPGERLTIEGWRRVAARFMQLPRFQNVTVFVEEQPSGVRLVFDLEPSHPIDKLEFPGRDQAFRRPISRARVRDQFGGLPSLEQVNDVEDTRPALSRQRRLPGRSGQRDRRADPRPGSRHPGRARDRRAADR